MKKFFLTAIVLGTFAVSCGTKESSMSTSNTDSTAAETAQSTPPATTTDTVASPTTNPDSIKITKDSASASPATK
ncbi:hypothetical protein SAMN05421664_2107 [Chryseobacterium soldanellicola]|uniref:Cytochrome C551 n=1 Tax=Chryseobacterium soldanellicola TaxID=311333 RepID=A0A1H1CSU5_9FLAO|nr:cytochrome C551 [Chryseobacterium soldanellicola]SDQ67325.1 hypothetical protein SAMN05421664_2107 [Chryseobacterium soldanellicola]